MAAEVEPAGYFSYREAGIEEGQRYAYRLDGGPERPDPCSRWQPDGVHQPSAVLCPEQFAWSDGNWRAPPLREWVIYEVHIGTFTPEGTFAAVIPRLESLRELGISAVEIMPVAQFPGGRNWGYDGVHWYAPQNSYGGPHGLQRLVDACHARGLAVVLDVVYNHFGPEGNYAGEFGPYLSVCHRTPWGAALNFDDAGSDAVRQFVLDNVRMWIDTYHCDGLRLDAVPALFDTRPTPILREIKEAADEAAARHGRHAVILAESLRNDVRILQPQERGGCGLDGEWNEDFHHAVHAYLTGEHHGKYMDYGDAALIVKALEKTFVLDGVWSDYRDRRWGAPVDGLPGDRFVTFMQNHDLVGNRAGGERLAALVSPSAQRLAASLLLLAPFVPFLFMGEEYGEDHPFPFFCSFLDAQLVEAVRRGRRREFEFLGAVPDPQAEATFAAARLSWSWPPGSDRAGLRRLYQDLLTARRHWPIFQNFTHRRSRLLPDQARGPVLELVRGAEPDQFLVAYFNLGAQPRPLEMSGPGRSPLFSSEDSRYQGSRPAGVGFDMLLPFECVAFGPPAWKLPG
jgi:maltooligosyltrehalose trehalohydrolase